jgi:hypothetical protein
LIALSINLAIGPIGSWHENNQPEAPSQVAPILPTAEMVVSPYTIFHVRGGSPLQAYIKLANIGGSVATITSWRFGVSVLEAKIGDNAASLNSLGGLEPETGVANIPPRDEPLLRYREIPPLSDNDVEAIKSNENRIYVFGEITYTSDSNKERIVRFCHMYSGIEYANVSESKAYIRSQVRFCPYPNLNYRN